MPETDTFWPIAWRFILGGSVLFIIAAGLGRALARDGHFPASVMRWWIDRVVLRLVATRSTMGKAIGIFLNNGLVLALLMASGVAYALAVIAIAAAGLSLGVALHLLGETLGARMTVEEDWDRHLTDRSRAVVRIGFVLNMLEPPAVALVLGLALARAPLGLSWTYVWQLFGVWVLPALLLAGLGEACWLTHLCPQGGVSALDRCEGTDESDDEQEADSPK